MRRRESSKYFYLRDKSVACFLSGYELSLSFASLFNCDERTEEFFTNNGTYIRIHDLANRFMATGGLSAFSRALRAFSSDSGEYIPITMLWPAVTALTEIMCSVATEQHNREEVVEFASALVKRLRSTGQSEIDVLTKDRYRVNRLFKNLKTILQVGAERVEAEEAFEKLKVKFSILRTEPNLSTINQSLANAKENLQDEEELRYAVEILRKQFEECKEKVDEILASEPVAKALKHKNEWRVPHKNCDKRETESLDELKNMLLNNQIAEARKLIRWKKTLIALAEYSGWELAGIARKQTYLLRKIEATDIIKAGLTIYGKMFGAKEADKSPKLFAEPRTRANSCNRPLL